MSLSSLRVEEVGEGDLRKSGSFKNSLSRATTGVYLLFTSFILVLVCNANFFSTDRSLLLFHREKLISTCFLYHITCKVLKYSLNIEKASKNLVLKCSRASR